MGFGDKDKPAAVPFEAGAVVVPFAIPMLIGGGERGPFRRPLAVNFGDALTLITLLLLESDGDDDDCSGSRFVGLTRSEGEMCADNVDVADSPIRDPSPPIAAAPVATPVVV